MRRLWHPWRALLWEYGRLSWRSLLGVTIACCCLAALYRQALLPFGARRDGLVFSALFMTLLVVIVLSVLNCRSEGLALGFEARLFRLPLATWKLVLGRLLPSLVMAAAIYLLVAAFMIALYDAQWPVAGPLLVTLVVQAWALALLWSLGRRPHLLLPASLPLVLALFGWLRPRLGPDQIWDQLSGGDVGVLAIAGMTATAVAIVGVGYERGQPPGPQQPALLRHRSETASRLEAPAGPVRSQLSMEWREKGRYLPLWAVFGVAINVAAACIPEVDTPRVLRAGLASVVFFLAVGPPISGFLHGRFDRRRAGLDPLRATRPLSDRDLAWALLLASARSVLATWLAALFALGAVVAGLSLLGNAAPVAESLGSLGRTIGRLGLADGSLLLLALLAYGWSASGLVASVALTGRNWAVTLFALPPYGLVMAALLADRFADVDLWSRLLPFIATSVLLAPLLFLASGLLAVRRGHLSGRWLSAAVLLWAASSLALGWRFFSPLEIWNGIPAAVAEPAIESSGPLLLPATIAGCLLPLTLAPLAIEWNRHR